MGAGAGLHEYGACGAVAGGCGMPGWPLTCAGKFQSLEAQCSTSDAPLDAHDTCRATRSSAEPQQARLQERVAVSAAAQQAQPALEVAP
mgnify:CR=1 FL=1